jgi:hypothetical protein
MPRDQQLASIKSKVNEIRAATHNHSSHRMNAASGGRLSGTARHRAAHVTSCRRQDVLSIAWDAVQPGRARST